MQNRLTIKDIARLNGVGKSTVSRIAEQRKRCQRAHTQRRTVMNQHGFPLPARARHAGAER